MTLWQHYYLANDISDALRLMAEAPAPSLLVAGGTDLLLDLQQGRHAPVASLIDVTTVPEMNVLEIRAERLYVGAARPISQVINHPLVAEHAQALREAAGLIGGPQVRNTATLGGNVAHALPAADGTISLLALDALADVIGPQGRKMLPLEACFLGPGRSALTEGGDLLVGFHIPLRQPGQASAFRRIMRPQGVAIAILNTSVWLERQGELIAAVRIAVGPAAPIPFRARRTEQVLLGKPVNPATLQIAHATLLEEAHFRTSPHRATAEYRRQVSGDLLAETLITAWERSFDS